MNNKEIIVSIYLDGKNIRIRKLWVYIKNYKESASFEYEKEWLSHPLKFAL